MGCRKLSYYQEEGLGKNYFFSGVSSEKRATELFFGVDYYPYGKILREWNPSTEKYVTTHHQRDTETGLDYRGARYYDADVARFLSLDPLAMEFADISAYNYVLANPVMLVDPDGRNPWIPELDDNGDVQYKAEKGDNLMTLKEQYGLSVETTSKIAVKSGLDKSAVKSIKEGTTISGKTVKSVTGSEILKLSLSSKDRTDSDVINQVLFAMEHADVTKGWYTRDYFGDVDSRILNGDHTAFAGVEEFKGTTTKFSTTPVNITMRFATKEEHAIVTIPGSDHNWVVPGQNNRYAFHYPVHGASRPNIPMFLRFKGEKNMINFTKHYGFEFSGVEK